MAILKFANLLWEESKPKIVLTDNKLVIRFRFFHTKAIQPSLRNARDYVLQSPFKIAHLAASVNTSADFLFRIELKVTEKIRLKIREDVQKTPIEVTKSSSDVAEEEQCFFRQADGEDETEKQIVKRKEQSRKKATEWVANEESFPLKLSIKEVRRVDGNTTSYSINGIRQMHRCK